MMYKELKSVPMEPARLNSYLGITCWIYTLHCNDKRRVHKKIEDKKQSSN